MSPEKPAEKEFSFKDYFVPFTAVKAVHWLVLVGVIIFFNGLFNGFISDDHALIVTNPYVHSAEYIPRLFFENRLDLGSIKILGVGFYRPIIDSYYTTVNLLWGLNPFIYHFIQIIFVIANAVLLFLVLRNFFNVKVSFLLALIFLIHPANSEIALYIADTADVFYFFFGITALYTLSRTNSWKGLLGAAVLLLCALLSKESGVLFVIISLLYVFIFKRQLFKKMLLVFLGILFIWGLLRLNAIGMATYHFSNAPMQRADFITRMAHVPAIIFFYIKEIFLPINMSLSYQWFYPQITADNFYIPLMFDVLFFVLIFIFGLAIYRSNDKKNFLKFIFFVLWFCFGLGLHLQLFPLDETVAERYIYFQMVGLLGIVGVASDYFKVNLKNIWVVSIIVLVLSLFCIRTFVRTFDWRTDYVLTHHDIHVSKNSYALEYALSTLYLEEGNLQEAKKHGERSIDLFPFITNYTNLGVIYLREGNYKKAKEAYLKALEYGDDQVPYDNLAQLALIYGNHKEDIKFLRGAAKKFPHSATIWLSLAILEYVEGDKTNAQISIDQAKRYATNQHILFIHDVISNDKPLHLKIDNGQIQFDTSQASKMLE